MAIRRPLNRLRAAAGRAPDLFPIATVAIAWLFGQVIVLSQTPAYALFPDSLEYLASATRILHGGGFFDPVRPPVYPALLALLQAVAGGKSTAAVPFVQGGLMGLFGLVLYGLGKLLTGNRWLAAAVAAVTLTNLYLLDWERAVLTETLSLTLVGAVLLVTARFAASGRSRELILIGVVAVLLVLTHVAEVAAVIAIVGGIVWMRPEARTVLAGGAIAAALGLYVLGNGVTSGHYTLACTGQSNLYMKVLEYRLLDQADRENFPSLYFYARDYADNPIGPTGFFMTLHPEFNRQCSPDVIPFAGGVLLAHPVASIGGGFTDSVRELFLPPAAYTPLNMGSLLTVSGSVYGLYYLLPVALLWLAVRGRLASRRAPLLLGIVAAAVLVNLLAGGFGAVSEYARQRAPLDPEAFLLVIVAGADAGLLALRQISLGSETAKAPEMAIGPTRDSTAARPRSRRRRPASARGT